MISEWTTGAPAALMGLALASVGSVGACTCRLGQGLGCFHSSHGGSRCATTAVVVPDFSGSALVDLRWWLC